MKPQGALSQEEVQAVCRSLLPVLQYQRQQADHVDSWTRPDSTTGFDVPKRAGTEHRQLAKLARTPWLGLVVTNVAQAMYVDNIITDGGEDRDLWRLWQDNGMAAHQISNHRAMVTYGHSYGVVTPAELNGVSTARMRCLSPRRVACQWEDAAMDLYPQYALEAVSGSPSNRYFKLYDPLHVYSVVQTAASTDGWAVTDVLYHGVGVAPVVRFANILDLDGRVVGEVEPFIPTAARINKTSYDRLLAQHFSSWKVRTIAGIDLPENEDPGQEAKEVEEAKLRLAQEDLLVSEDENTKFGTLEGTHLDTFVHAWRADIEALAAVSQTPAHALTGQLVNLNAEALAAARAPLTQKVWERQVNAGASYSRMIRLAASISGLDAQAADPLVRVSWQDMEIRSISQAVDALGKAASMLRIPVRGLWGRIPGVERSDIQEWERLAGQAAKDDPIRALLRDTDPRTSDQTPSPMED